LVDCQTPIYVVRVRFLPVAHFSALVVLLVLLLNELGIRRKNVMGAHHGAAVLHRPTDTPCKTDAPEPYTQHKGDVSLRSQSYPSLNARPC
jgi:hypothetical protein